MKEEVKSCTILFKEDKKTSKKKYRKWIKGNIFPTISDSSTQNSNVPNQLHLKPKEPGVIFGTSSHCDSAIYVGMPYGEEGNILIIGGNGSGKSSSVVMPTLCVWAGAMCVTDIKGELSDFYAKSYQEGKVTRRYIVFDPTDPETPSYDPFGQLLQDNTENLVRNIWDITNTIITLSPDEREPFWTQSEQAVFAAALIHYNKFRLSFSETICKMQMTSLSLLCDEIAKSGDILANSFLGEIASMKPEVLAAIDRGLRNKLMLFATDPYIGHAFRGARENAKCFTWADLDEYNIFLRIPADRIEQWSGAINLMYTQLIRHLERRPDKYSPQGKNNVPTLLMMDEFARFGKLEIITSAMSTLRSKNVNICPIIQSIAQLDKIYGEYDRRIIFDNCQYQAILRANDADTQKYLSDLIGTVKGIQKSVSENMDDFMDTTGYSTTETTIRKMRVFPHELSTLHNILLITPYGFCKVDKIHPGTGLEDKMYFPISTSEQVLRFKVDTRSPDTAADQNGKLIIYATTTPAPLIPEEPRPHNFVKNEGAKMLTTEERTKNADNRIDEIKHQQRQKQRQNQETQKKTSQRRNYIIGELVCKHFPELLSLEPKTVTENATIFASLESFLSVLSADKELMEQLKQRATHITL